MNKIAKNENTYNFQKMYLYIMRDFIVNCGNTKYCSRPVATVGFNPGLWVDHLILCVRSTVLT